MEIPKAGAGERRSPQPKPFSSEQKPWQRMPNEPMNYYECFLHYRDQDKRSIREVYKECKEQVSAIVYTTLEVNARRWRWVERCDAWDRYKQQQRDEAYIKGVAKATEKNALQIELSAQRTLLESARIAFSQMTDVAEWGPDGLRLFDSKDLPEDVRAAIMEIQHDIDAKGGSKTKIKLHPKMTALQKLGEHFGLWQGDDTKEKPLFVILLEALESGKFEKEIELAEEDFGPIDWKE